MTTTMKAIGLRQYLPIAHPEALIDLILPVPEPGAHDLLVRVEAVSVNPVDAKVRGQQSPTPAQPRVLGWDAAGTVVAVGSAVTRFAVGDAVYFAGDITRPGSNAQFTLVDERIVGPKPRSLDFAQAAALPLTAITAWEALFDRLGLESTPAADSPQRGQSILVIGAGGGVGSIAVQLAASAGLTVIGTASRPESQAWVRELGAAHVVDHRQDLRAQLDALGVGEVDHLLLLSDTDAHFPRIPALLRPQGLACGIVENTAPLDLRPLHGKSQGFVWEMMFARSMYRTPDMAAQHALLAEVARRIDAGALRGTLREVLGPIDAAHLREAHRRIESGHTMGKLVLAGWGATE